jgi:hypothetical protein
MRSCWDCRTISGGDRLESVEGLSRGNRGALGNDGRRRGAAPGACARRSNNGDGSMSDLESRLARLRHETEGLGRRPGFTDRVLRAVDEKRAPSFGEGVSDSARRCSPLPHCLPSPV